MDKCDLWDFLLLGRFAGKDGGVTRLMTTIFELFKTIGGWDSPTKIYRNKIGDM